MKTVAFHTLGCKVNQYETNAMEKLFRDSGYEVVPFDGFADIYVVNTCTVTSVGDKKSRQVLRRAKSKNKNAVIAAVGCLAQVAPEEAEKIECVDVIIGINRKSEIVDAIEAVMRDKKRVTLVNNLSKSDEFDEMPLDAFSGRHRAYIKIQEGCDKFCSYCIVPYARGRSRSRNETDILQEAQRLGENGFPEVVLTGIHVDSYGTDTGTELSALLSEMHEIDGIKRIRLSSIDPLAFTDEFIKALSALPKVCPHFHISLQSGSDAVLNKMNRGYTAAQYLEVLEKLRATIADISITTDMITGFPTETEEEFQKSLAFAAMAKFSDIHVFPYSERKGTPAAGFSESVPKNIRNERAQRLSELSVGMKKEFMSKFTGAELPVLFEKEQDGMWIGFTPNYLKAAVKSEDDISGKIFDVKVMGVQKKSKLKDCFLMCSIDDIKL